MGAHQQLVHNGEDIVVAQSLTGRNLEIHESSRKRAARCRLASSVALGRNLEIVAPVFGHLQSRDRGSVLGRPR